MVSFFVIPFWSLIRNSTGASVATISDLNETSWPVTIVTGALTVVMSR
ncbi:MAG: hypothetical protein IPJ37_05080 [Bacteroidales bacterium]|nr:hypothetical protein [Bacteroidales bacterium]